MRPMGTKLLKWLISVAAPVAAFATWVNTSHPHMPTTPDEWWVFGWQAIMWIGGGGVLGKASNHFVDILKDAMKTDESQS